MLRGRRAVVSVYLCFVCLLTPMTQASVDLCSRDIIKQISFLITKEPHLKWLNCSLYTPTRDDYQKCPHSMMKCFADETKVLMKEWGTVARLPRLKLNISLEKLANLLNQTESECLQCEFLKVEKADAFLQSLHQTIEMINSENCGTPLVSTKNLKRFHNPPFTS